MLAPISSFQEKTAKDKWVIDMKMHCRGRSIPQFLDAERSLFLFLLCGDEEHGNHEQLGRVEQADGVWSVWTAETSFAIIDFITENKQNLQEL